MARRPWWTCGLGPGLTAACLAALVLLHILSAAWAGTSWHEQDYLPHKVQPLSNYNVETLAEKVDGDDLYWRLFKPILIPRVVGTAGHAQVRNFIKDHFTKFGKWRLEEDTFVGETPHGPKEFTNLVFTLDPYAKRRLVLAAHYDSKFFAKGKFVGATDSAMPCAMLMHIAEILDPYLNPRSSGRHDVTLQFIFFDGEEAFDQWSSEDSIYGARHLAERFNKTFVPMRPTAPLAEDCAEDYFSLSRELEEDSTQTQLQAMDALVLLDLIGHKGVRFPIMHESTSHLYASLQRAERTLNELDLLDGKGRTAYFGSNINHLEDWGVGDDHTPFEELDVPILHLIQVPFPKFWHTLDDNARVIDKPSSANLVRILAVFVAEYLHLNDKF